MKNKINLKYLFDTLMTIIILLLMDYSITGLALHEWLGIAIFIMFAAHKLFNYKWIKQITMRFFDKKIKPRVKIMYFLDVLLLIFLIVVTASGILLSENIFAFELQNRSFWVGIHDISAYGILITISVHVGMHWKNIINAVRKIVRIKKSNIIRTIFIRMIALLLISAGIKSYFDNAIDEKILLTDVDNGDVISDNTSLLNSENSKTSRKHGIAEETAPQEEIPTLEEYLGSLNCTLCSKHCSLLAPQCSKGEAVAAQAEITYNTLYVQTASADTESADTADTVISDNSIDFSQKAADVSGLFANYLPVMGLYIGSTYYVIELIDRKKH